MSDFSLCKKLVENYRKQCDDEDENDEYVEKKIGVCSHENTVSEKGLNVCVDCGLELQQKIVHNKEWKYLGQLDSKHMATLSDPKRKNEERTIFKDVENLDFSERIVAIANVIYTKVTGGHIFRGNSRKSIVFACIFHAFKMEGKPQSHDKLIKIFGLDRKTALKGLKYVILKAPKGTVKTTYITPANLIEEIMDLFGATLSQKQEVIELFHQLKNKSSRLNRSRPQSMASGIVYYWIRLKKKNISIKEFVQKVSLSEMTINKLVREIAEVRGTPDVL